LVEVLVAIIVLSIGLLGIAGLQVATTKYKINSWSRSASASLLSDLSERVRMNPRLAGANFANQGVSPLAYTLNETWTSQQSKTDNDLKVSPICEISPFPTTTPTTSVTCTAAERAASDMSVWRMKVRQALPQGAALVEGNRGAGFIVTLMWFDKENTDSQERVDDGSAPSLVAANTCTANDKGLAQQTCCPDAAKAPAGVRCARFSFTP
jgi:type IV pilus assembly protein PilV